MSGPTAYLAFTAPINPSGATPVLTKEQIWEGLHRKVRHAEEFVPGAISSTEVLEETKDDKGRDVVRRQVVFAGGNNFADKQEEKCVFYPMMKVEFLRPDDGSRVLNTIADGADGQLYMTYQFEFYMKEGTSKETEQENLGKWHAMSQKAVESSIEALRTMVKDGRIKA